MTNTKTTDNSFDFIRIAAAFSVLLSHSFPLSGLPEIYYGKNITIGTLGVFTFFAISGYLIQQSWDRSKSIPIFVISRLFRIYPALIVCLLLTTALLSFASKLTWTDYFGNIITYNYVKSNIFPILIPWQDSLPGVFENTIFPRAINGSLWSIRYEIFMYFMLLLLILGAKNSTSLLTVIILIAFSIWGYAYTTGLRDPGQVIWRIQYINLDSTFLFKLTPFFLIGALLSKLPLKIFHKYICTILLFFAFLLKESTINLPLLWISLPYCVIYAAIRLPAFFKNWARHGDFSFGIYLYAFPIQQVISNIDFFHGKHVLNILLSCVLVLTFSYFSWHVVEAPFMNLRYQFIKLLKK